MVERNTQGRTGFVVRDWARIGLLAGVSALAVQSPALMAQTTGEDQTSVTEPTPGEITVTGTRAIVQGSIDEKRKSVLVFDALSADEVGDLPALSIGEALETLTGAASHREQGGATEISVRGLGPFLGSTVVNGRAATNGSGDRSVNFSQFPSELFNKAGIYKTQSANMIEGGVAGQIVLDTVKPLDFGKQRIQFELKGNHNPQNADIDKNQRFVDLGYRGTISLLDQFTIGGTEVGISLGFQRNVQSNPEQEARVSDTINYCVDNTTGTTGLRAPGNCEVLVGGVQQRPAVAGTEDFVVARNSYTYRQNITDDERDTFFGAIQIKPSSSVDINLDFQYADRVFSEQRNDLVFAEGRRIDDRLAPLNTRLNYDLIVGEFGALRQFTGETSIETNSEYLERAERYYGGGASIAVQASDRLKLSADVSYSETTRTEESVQVRMRQRGGRDIFGNLNRYPRARQSNWVSGNTNTSLDRIETAYQIGLNGSQTFNMIVQNFDVNDHSLFSDDARTRFTLSQDRFNSIWGARGDFTYEMDGFFSAIQGGVRFQELVYRDVPGGVVGASRVEVTYSNAALAVANQECRTPFPERGFLSDVSGGNPLITNVDANGNVINAGNTFASFDALCLARTLEANDPRGITFDSNGVPIYPDGRFESIDNNDVTEQTWAGYLQADYDSTLGELPVRGNFGLRVVKTSVTSRGFRGPLTVSPAPGGGFIINAPATGDLIPIVGRNDYTSFLPSFNFVADVTPELQGRAAVFRALSRPDPSQLGFGRVFRTVTDTDANSVDELIGLANATGNPQLNPLLSWNFDAALEWYPDKDTILAGGVYYKRFNGGFETVGQLESFDVNGTPLDALVTTQQTTATTSTIYGFELTAAHRLSFLPAPLDGLGFKLSYNFAKANFRNEDGFLGAFSTVQPDGSITTVEALIPPANLFGLSKHVLSAQAYYEIGPFDFQGVYKYRSPYFQQFVGDSSGRLRFTDQSDIFEARVSVKLNDQLRLSFEALNLFSEPRRDFRPTMGDLSQNLVYGARYFLGLRGRF
jgi:TonB-dependent receptor